MAEHPGFKAVARQIAAKRGVSMKRARGMLAAGTRRAGAAARKRNPRLNRVKGGMAKALIILGWQLVKAAGRPVPKEQSSFDFDAPAAAPALKPAAAAGPRVSGDWKQQHGGAALKTPHGTYNAYETGPSASSHYAVIYHPKRGSPEGEQYLKGGFPTLAHAQAASEVHHASTTRTVEARGGLERIHHEAELEKVKGQIRRYNQRSRTAISPKLTAMKDKRDALMDKLESMPLGKAFKPQPREQGGFDFDTQPEPAPKPAPAATAPSFGKPQGLQFNRAIEGTHVARGEHGTYRITRRGRNSHDLHFYSAKSGTKSTTEHGSFESAKQAAELHNYRQARGKPAARPTAEHREAAASIDRNKLDFKPDRPGSPFHTAHATHGSYSLSERSNGEHSLHYRANKRLKDAPHAPIDIGSFDSHEAATTAAQRHHRDVTQLGHKHALSLLNRYAPDNKPLRSLREPVAGPGGHTNLASYLAARGK